MEAHNFKNLLNQKFGKLTVIKRAKNDKNGHSRWICKCECGNIKEVLSTHLIRKNILSCGCDTRRKKMFNFTKKFGKNNFYKYKRLYNIFNSMRRRCYNFNSIEYKNYGARGIKVCNDWLNDFENFYNWAMQNGYKENLTIDRIDVNGNYEPNNCRWVDMETQENNRRNNVVIDYNKQKHTLKEWSKILKIPYGTIYTRYSKGFPVEYILSKKDLRRK